jgi:hypothetical protein
MMKGDEKQLEYARAVAAIRAIANNHVCPKRDRLAEVVDLPTAAAAFGRLTALGFDPIYGRPRC